MSRERHGHTQFHKPSSPTYNSWHNMLKRVRCQNSKGYETHGGRGITVCERWLTFINFLADMGERPGREFSIDRINNSKGYEPGNCKWSTAKEQVNNRRNNIRLTVDGTTKTLTQWAEHNNIKPATAYGRMRKGWSLLRACGFKEKAEV